MTRTVSAAQIKAMLHDGRELALLDVREQGQFGRGHLLFAVNIPLSGLDTNIFRMVPRLGTRTVLCDGGEGLAERAGALLAGWGYTDVALLEGGVESWRQAGYVLFGGLNVPSKAFGEFVEHESHTPSISAEELNAYREKGEKLVVLDSRPMDEFHNMNIPGGVDVPGAELAYRIGEMAPETDALVVVNCAGRTRSIIGAQSLINAGVPHRVVALRNGTMGWHLAGFQLEHGQSRAAPAVSPANLAEAQRRAARVAERYQVQFIEPATLEQWRGERDQHSLYVLDVRSPEEFEAGHLPDAQPAPGGQLVQATDRYVGTRNARLVLVDDTEVRAIMTAHWLNQMGWDSAYVLRSGLPGARLESGPYRAEVPGLSEARAESVDAATLAKERAAGSVTVLDVGGSLPYRGGHIPGAWFIIRARLGDDLGQVPAGDVVVTAPDEVPARLAAAEINARHGRRARYLAGGTAAWRAHGGELAAGMEHLASEPDDVFLKAYDRETGVEEAMREYLSWEVDLVQQIAADGDARFRTYPIS